MNAHAAGPAHTPKPKSAKDAGWDVGVRETVPVALPGVWKFLLGPGLPLWLGETDLALTKGAKYQTHDGVSGEVKAYTENSTIKLTWKPDDWPHVTQLRVTVKETVLGTTIAINHDLLADREERRMMLGHWKNVITDVVHAIDQRAK